ncbi:U11/U12 small nuclear ribonucleoprotein 59 kDa protein [Asparagus officinalis]|uniref:U11/U12 small nuclear ribonucleoprotein 59 kDa protein n=1 Tax=Asparagus officinalis TaxID=4686 RepID=UPI00098E10FE|nr:U11/U12 small nuclear ribonucleoprotein 59 kDa protein [Asparagus officinalis]
MIRPPLYPGAPPPLPAMQPQLPAMQTVQSPGSSFWDADNVRSHLRNLQEAVYLAKALYVLSSCLALYPPRVLVLFILTWSSGRRKELEEINLIRQSNENNASVRDSFCDNPSEKNSSSSANDLPLQVPHMLKESRIGLDTQESLSLEAARSLVSSLRDQLVPFRAVTSETSSWEEKSLAARLAQKLQKAKRNKRWKKKKRKRVAELLRKERESYNKADQDADEWRAREIAKDIAKRKVEDMKAIAKLKANEDRKRLESELELVLVVEKLQELRSIRIQKLKKQGMSSLLFAAFSYFTPFAQVNLQVNMFHLRRALVLVEELILPKSAADTAAAKDAIATAELSQKSILDTSCRLSDNKGEESSDKDLFNEIENERSSSIDMNLKADPQKNEGQVSASGYDSIVNLPYEFYHYYHGSSNDMGTLIEVRRMWDAYIRPGGSRIPGHWVQPAPPANDVWASYLVDPK